MSLISLSQASTLGLPQNRSFSRGRQRVKALINVGYGFADLVSGRLCTLTGAVQRTVGPAGRRFYAASAGIYASHASGLVNGSPVTLVVVSTSTSGNHTALLSDAAGSWSCPRVEATSGVVSAVCKVSGGTNLTITGPTVTVGKTFCAVVHWAPGAGLKASFNGTEVQSASNSATSLYVSPSNLVMGGGTGSNVYLMAALSGALSDAEILDLSATPWKLLQTDSRKIWLPSSESGSTLSASGGAQTDGSATLQAQVALSALGVAVAGGSAGIQADIPLSAAGFSVSSGSAGLTATVSISAAGLAQAAGQAGLAAEILLAGAGAASAAGNAALAAQLDALAAGAAQASGSATLSGGSPGAISASGGATATGSAVLTVSVQLAASAGAQAGGAGNLAATVTLTAAGFVQAMGAGALFVSVDLAASGQAAAGGVAHLSSLEAVLLAVDARYVATARRRSYVASLPRRSFEVRS
ncbi:MAG: hypothetical protein HWD57_10985 [Candidatus Accumulibacter cognatus]|uniref:Uncharacterized protein n=1 Tax=Candidatus Accumulibacter cognatus TaxID=2954383 RepID=A0A7D5NAI4_9PROT|nr:MAG: hypothetical protein HWD57_10985 [Candidatus Accumulibacter cognatus]